MSNQQLVPSIYEIPQVINPLDSVCVVVNVPNDQTHINNFFVAINSLTYWNNYRRDPLKQGTQAAKVWRNIYEQLEWGQCTVPTQYRLVDCEVLEFSVDGGLNWQLVADFSDCFVALHPATNTRNEVTPVGGALYPLILGLLASSHWKAYPGLSGELTVDLAGHGGLAIQRYINSFTGAIQWITGGRYFDATRFDIAYPFGNATNGIVMRDDGKVGLGTDTPLARLHAKQSSTERGLIVEMPASANYNAVEIRKSGGVMIAGIDKNGDVILSKYADPTGHTPVENFAIVGSSADSSLWWFDGGFWVRGWSELDGQVISEVIATNTPGATEGDVTLVNGSLNVSFPDTGVINRIYHAARPRPGVGDTDSVVIALDANGAQAIPWELGDGDIIKVSQFSGWMNDGSAMSIINEGYRGDGTLYYSGDPASNVLGYRSESVPPMSLLMAYNIEPSGETQVETPDLLTGYELLDVRSTAPYGIFYPNTTIVPNACFGNIQFLCELTAGGQYAGCGIVYFTSGQGGWSLKGANVQPIIPGGGQARNRSGGAFLVDEFASTTECYDPVNTPEFCEDAIIIIAYLPNTVTGRFRMLYTVDATEQPYGVELVAYFRINGVWQGLGIQVPDDPTNDWTMPGSPKIFDALCIYLWAHPSLYQNGSFAIQAIEIICD